MGRMDPASRRLLRARDAMDRSYAEPLDVPALARIARTSKAHASGRSRRPSAKGGGNGVIFSVEDCRRTYEELVAKGVEFTQEPTQHFYGIDCGLRDPSGKPVALHAADCRADGDPQRGPIRGLQPAARRAGSAPCRA